MKWNFRPSALSLTNFAKETRRVLESLYDTDNQTAAQHGVSVPPRPDQKPVLRTLQWNVQAFACDDYKKANKTAKEIMDTILEADPDVIVLNEYHWNDQDSRHARIEKRLREQGYVFLCANVFAPTLVATRWYQRQPLRVVRLSIERSALMTQIEDPETMKSVWIVGTHLDYADGVQRHKEMGVLLDNLSDGSANDAMIITGDLNQQRQQDYTADEWDKIAAGMDYRRTCHDDGVAGLLHGANFKCAWNHGGVETNWDTDLPPSTHWSGTIVDYSYSRGVSAKGVYVSAAGASDHRMTVCDWELEKQTCAANEDRQ